jgi:hypothetical protein
MFDSHSEQSPRMPALPASAPAARIKADPFEVVMAPDSGTDFEREWAVLGSNQ